MKLKRIAAVITALVAIAPFSAYNEALVKQPVLAAEQSSMESEIGTLPEWTPMNFIDAMEFYNTYGKTHVEDNFICLVKPMRSDEIDKYRTSYSGSMAMINTPACTSAAVFELEIPEQPDQIDEEALAEYEEFCNKLGIPTDDYSFFENYAKSEVQYVFKVQMFRVLEGHDLTVEWIEDLGENYKKKIIDTFTFENSIGYIEQTDIYNWLPDCPTEYNRFKSNIYDSPFAPSRACVYRNPYTLTPYIAYCADVNASTGASLEMKQNGDGEIEFLMESDCNGFDFRSKVELVGGQSSSSVIVYEPIKDGLVDVEWSVGRYWSDEASFDITKERYHIKNNCSEIYGCPNGSTIISFIDKATGELIDIPEDSSFFKSTIPNSPDEPCLNELFPIDSNPCIIYSNKTFDSNYNYSFNIRTEDGYYDFEGFEITSEEEKHITVNCYLSYKANPEPVVPDGATRVIIYDKDTGELIPDEVLKYHKFSFGTSVGIKNTDDPDVLSYTNPFYTVDSNNFIIRNDQLAHYYKYADSFEFTYRDKPEVIYYSNESMDIIFRTKIKVSGNINGDRSFSVADVVTLQKWLLGAVDVEIQNGAQADYNLDGKLDVFDLCLMKKEYVIHVMSRGEPVAVSVTQGGGYAGEMNHLRIYSEGDKYKLSYFRERKDTEPIIVDITEEDYLKVMGLDYDSYFIEDDSDYIISDGYFFDTMVTYSSGMSETSAVRSSPIVNTYELLNKYIGTF